MTSLPGLTTCSSSLRAGHGVPARADQGVPCRMDDTIARILDAAYMDDLEARPIEEIRAMRAECQEIETGLSFLRRVVQGHLDIVAAEVARRRDGGEPADVAALVDRLPEILADHLRAPGN